MAQMPSIPKRLGAALALLSALSASSARAEEPARQVDQHFVINPVADIVLTAAGAGFSGLLSFILSTGEIVPAPPGSPNNLLGIDRVAVTQTIDPNASTISDITLWSAVGFAALDPILSGFRDGRDAALVDAVMYAEAISLTETLTDITKIAVRRPRPIDYINYNKSPSNTNTDLELSFFSGHASTVGAISATATYLAFVRSPRSPRPWITLGVGALLTSFVSYERVRSGAHFPTDVVAGSMAGIAIGVLVPHLHLHADERPTVWVGAAPAPGGGTMSLQGVF
jgi:undecaprenyl-diphosphatase